MKAYVAKQGYAQCPRCSVFVERVSGCLLMTCMCGCMFCYRCKKVAVSQSEASCACQPGHRFLSLAEMGLSLYQPRPGVNKTSSSSASTEPRPSFAEDVDITLLQEMQEENQRSKARDGWSRIKRKVRLGFIHLKNGMVGLVAIRR